MSDGDFIQFVCVFSLIVMIILWPYSCWLCHHYQRSLFFFFSFYGNPAVKFWNKMVDSNSNTLRDVMKADISLGNSGASNCWTTDEGCFW